MSTDRGRLTLRITRRRFTPIVCTSWVHGAWLAIALLSVSFAWGQAPPAPAAIRWVLPTGTPAHPPTALPVAPAAPTSALCEMTLSDAWIEIATAAQPPVKPAAPFTFLYRTTQPPQGARVECELRFGKDTTGGEVPLKPSLNWQVVTCQRQGGWPEGAWQLALRAHPDAQVELLLPFDPAVAWSPTQALWDLASYLGSVGRTKDVQGVWQGLIALRPGTGEASLARACAADAQAAAGDRQGAAQAYLDLLNENGRDIDRVTSFPGGPGYFQNRAALDFVPRAQARLAELGRGLPTKTALAAYRAAAMEYPLLPPAKAAALETARLLCQTGDSAQAPAWLVLALDQGGDHDPVQAKLRLPENQAHLDAISRPTDAKVLSGTLGLLLALGDGVANPELISRCADLWTRGEEAGLRRDREECQRQFQRAAVAASGTTLEPCARIALSQWLQYLGWFIEAGQVLPAEKDVRHPAVAQWRAFQQGRLAVSEGIYEEGLVAFNAAATGPSPVIGDYSRFYRAECLEFTGQWATARQAYSDQGRSAAVPDVERKAKFAASRVAAIAKECKPAFGTSAYYWGEDRQTQGEWEGYGESAFILCVGGSPADLMAGPLAPFTYRVSTTDPSRQAWPWSWGPVAPHPSVLRNPSRAVVQAANWDDGGEKYPVGTGPDLLAELPVPAGAYRLSLYLTNDFDYYEPNREFTMYLLDEKHEVLAACPVRQHEGGVYYHFAVKGPQRVTVRISRDLSMNVLLQGLFLDRLDTPVSTTPASAYGPLGDLLSSAPRPHTATACADFGSAAERHRQLARLSSTCSDTLGDTWATYRMANAYGVGRLYEEGYRDQLRDSVRRRIGQQDAWAFWRAVAAAQRAAGLRSGVVRYTRIALQAAAVASMTREQQLATLEKALDTVHAGFPLYYRTAPGRQAKQPQTLPTDEVYALELADQYAARAFQGQNLMRAAADVLPLARKYWQEDQTLALRLFDAVGMDNLGSADLMLYAACTEDAAAKAKALRSGIAAGAARTGLPGADLVWALAGMGDWDGVETELNRVLADSHVSASDKAALAYSAAGRMLTHKHREGAKKWLELVVDRFADTQYARLAKSRLAKGLSLPWEGRSP